MLKPGENICNHGLGKAFLDMTKKEFSIKKSEKLDFIRTEKVYSLEDTIKKIRSPVKTWEKYL